jgi:hypothetical protein
MKASKRSCASDLVRYLVQSAECLFEATRGSSDPSVEGSQISKWILKSETRLDINGPFKDHDRFVYWTLALFNV